MASILTYKGLADIVVAAILTVKPSLIYESLPATTLASFSGLHVSNAEIAPGFNQAIACMIAAVGVGEMVAARFGPAARPAIFAMNVAWAVLGYAACATPREWGLGSATMLMTSINHTLISLTMYLFDPAALSGNVPETKKRR